MNFESTDNIMLKQCHCFVMIQRQLQIIQWKWLRMETPINNKLRHPRISNWVVAQI